MKTYRVNGHIIILVDVLFKANSQKEAKEKYLEFLKDKPIGECFEAHADEALLTEEEMEGEEPEVLLGNYFFG